MIPNCSKTHSKRMLERLRERSRKGNEAKARIRMEKPEQDWKVFEHLLRFAVSPDGRHVALEMPNGWYRCEGYI